jgi:DNA-binding response OmpR family regulator/signal transduction histidine kinase
MSYLPGEPPEDILAIEDDPATADEIARALDRGGYHFTRALTGAEGLARLQEKSYSLVVIDGMLPDCAGAAVCQSIKKRDPLLPVLILGARSMLENEIEGLNASADSYLTKPFDPAELLAHVKTVLRTRATQLFLAQYSQQLRLVTEIGHQITSILDLDRLISETVQLTQRAFALKCAGVGLLESNDVLWRLSWRDGGGEIQERVASISLLQGGPRGLIRKSKSIEVMPALIRAADHLIALDSLARDSRIVVPIVHRGSVLGALLACRESNGYFDEKDRLIMATLAGQLAVAVVNARLVMAQRRETQVALMLAQAAHVLNQPQSMSEMAQAIVRMITQLAGVAHSAIGFWQPAQGENILHSLHADSCILEELLRGLIARRDPNFLAALSNMCEPGVIHLPQGQARLQKIHAGPVTRELLAVPFLLRQQTEGALFILGQPAYHFDAYDRSLAIGLAQQVAGVAGNLGLLTRLQQERDQLQTILASMQGGVFLVDDRGQIAYCNPRLSAMMGTRAETFLGHSYRVFFQQILARSGDAEKARRELEAAVNQVTTLPVVDLTLPRPDASHLRIHFFPVKDKDELGRCSGWGGVVGDITREHEHLGRTSELLSSVSHELRTPLAAIKGFVTMLSGGYAYWDEGSRESYLRSINESADQLGRLIENVLEMARLDAGMACLRRRSVALASLVERAVQAARLPDREHDFEVSIMTGLPELEMDPLRIEQVLRNLLQNAVDSSPAGSKIIVRAEQQTDEVLISVADHGNGVPKENLAHVFDRFLWASQTSGGQIKCAGLGLYLSHELVIAHGGRIWAASEPGHGTTIYFTLPLECPSNGSSVVTIAPSAARAARQSGADAHLPWDVTSLLLVEDDAPAARVLKANLEAEGYKVSVACQGRVALEMAAHSAFQLVLLDLMLPDLDGFQVCEHLREFSSVPVIIITGKASERDKVRGLSVGADDYLVKPFSSKELVARVQAVLRRARSQSAGDARATLRFGDLTLDLAHRQVYLRGNIVALTAREYKLLSYMATNSGRVLSHSHLLAKVWGPEYADDSQYLWVCISRLRRKLEDIPERPRYIFTDPTAGYHFCEG